MYLHHDMVLNKEHNISNIVDMLSISEWARLRIPVEYQNYIFFIGFVFASSDRHIL